MVPRARVVRRLVAPVPLRADRDAPARRRPGAAARRRPASGREPRRCSAALAALTLALTLVWVAVPGWTYNFADGRTYALDALSGRLGLGPRPLLPQLDPAARPPPGSGPCCRSRLVSLLWWLPGGSGGSRPARRRSAGIALMLGAAALLPSAAARVPTRVVELEDPQVRKSGGHLHPDRWVIERTRYRGGWVLRVGERLEAPVRAGGTPGEAPPAAELIRNQPVPFTLDIREGDRAPRLLDPGPRSGSGRRSRSGRSTGRPGAPLVLAAHGPAPPGAAERGDPGSGGDGVAVRGPFSAVVPTLGRSPLLVPCLEALRREGAEIVVVDQGDARRDPRRSRGPRPPARAQPRFRGGDQSGDRRGRRGSGSPR